jgi:hypothetical protein
MRSFGSGWRYRNYPDKEYTSLVTALAFLRDAGIFGRFLIFKRHQFGTEMTSERVATRGSARGQTPSQTLHFLHPAASVSNRFFNFNCS